MGCGAIRPSESSLSKVSNAEYSSNSNKLPKRVLKGFEIVLKSNYFPEVSQTNKPSSENLAKILQNVDQDIPREETIHKTEAIIQNLKTLPEKTDKSFEYPSKLMNDLKNPSLQSFLNQVNSEIESLNREIINPIDLNSPEKLQEKKSSRSNLIDSSTEKKTSIKLVLNPFAAILNPIKDFEDPLFELSRPESTPKERKKTDANVKLEALEFALDIRLREEKTINSTKNIMAGINSEMQKILKKYSQQVPL